MWAAGRDTRGAGSHFLMLRLALSAASSGTLPSRGQSHIFCSCGASAKVQPVPLAGKGFNFNVFTFCCGQ